MNQRQKKFCLGVVAGKSNTQAAKDAGYAPKSAHNSAHLLMKKQEVIDFIADHAARAADVVRLDAAFVLDGLIENATNARDQIKPDFGASNRAFELLGRYLKLFVDQSEVTLTGDVKEYLDKIVDIIDQEVTDPATRERIVKRLVAESA